MTLSLLKVLHTNASMAKAKLNGGALSLSLFFFFLFLFWLMSLLLSCCEGIRVHHHHQQHLMGKNLPMTSMMKSEHHKELERNHNKNVFAFSVDYTSPIPRPTSPIPKPGRTPASRAPPPSI